MNRYLASVLFAVSALGSTAEARTMAEVLAAASPSDWRTLDPANLLYMETAMGRVIIELAPQFAPKHVDNIRALVRENYFDGLSINRVQDNFVVQWGDPDSKKAIRKAQQKIADPEFTRSSQGLPFTVLPDPDTYAPQVGFSDGFPVARDPSNSTAWPTHCYASLGVGRDNAADSGNGSELYVVIGHAPRQLDRNITTVGRVVQGIELLSSLPRGDDAMGMYAKAEKRVVIKSIRVAADLPESQRIALEALRTDTPTFAALIEARRNRTDEWYKVPAGNIDLCSVPLPVRLRMPPP
jgi:peptidylprolyl isomerase